MKGDWCFLKPSLSSEQLNFTGVVSLPFPPAVDHFLLLVGFREATAALTIALQGLNLPSLRADARCSPLSAG